MLFLCVHNAGRSQMALGWFERLAGDRAVAWSGGSEPGAEVNPSAIAAMAEIGIDISKEFPKPWTEEIVQAADVVITMGCGDACPLYPGKRYEDWELEDPAGQSVEAVRPIRDEIGQRVRALLDSLGVPTSLSLHRTARETGAGWRTPSRVLGQTWAMTRCRPSSDQRGLGVPVGRPAAGRHGVSPVSGNRARPSRAANSRHYWRNREWHIERARLYRLWNAGERAKKRREYVRFRMAEDPSYRLRLTLQIDFAARQRRARVSNPTPLLSALGCSWEAFRAYIQKQFPAGVTWHNYRETHEIDHVLPFKCFNFRKSEDRFLATHWSNLKLVPWKVNRRKNGRYSKADLARYKRIWKALYGPTAAKQQRLPF